MNFIPVSSSNLNRISYDESTHILTIVFNNGGMYSYHGVSVNIFNGLLNSVSKGRYFHSYIEGKYPYQKFR